MTAVPPPPYTPPTPPAPAPGAPPAEKKSGCLKWGLIGCGIVVVIGVIVACGIAFAVFGLIKRSTPYQESLHRVQSDSRVMAALGTPIEPGFFVGGKVSVDNGRGVADIIYSVKGPNGKAAVHVDANRDPAASGWEYSEIMVRPANGPPIDVLKP